MGKINVGRVLLGGLVASIVGNALGFLVNGVWLAPRWAAHFKTLGLSGFSDMSIKLSLLGLVVGFVEIWLYAALRPHYGAGPRTAIYAGLAAWALMAVTYVGSISVGLWDPTLTAITTFFGAVGWVVAALAGAALYQEAGSESLSMTARG